MSSNDERFMPNFDGDLAKSPLKLGHGGVTTSHGHIGM